MGQLSIEDILKDNNTRDPNSITSLSLTHKALTNVSCLCDFKNLEKLDLTFNNLTSLKGLELCLNLKWLKVQQNKLQTLSGIEGLTNLTVLDAGKNKLRSMNEVKNLVKLRALILNDNEITTISGLDPLKELNTLVLSRNPIRKMGNSLAKLKSIEKVSLSHCQLEAIDPSIKACTELEQLRLAHNDISCIPAELGHNKKLRILDLGNNAISKWPDLEALSSLVYLKNLNLLGNPIAEKAKLLKKIKKLAPNLQIFNAKRMDQLLKAETESKNTDAPSGAAMDDSKQQKKTKKDDKEKPMNNVANPFDTKSVEIAKAAGDLDEVRNDGKNETNKQKKKKEKQEKKAPVETADNPTEKRSKRKAEKADIDVIDDNETPFAELFAQDAEDDMKSKQKGDHKAIDSISALVTFPGKKKKKAKSEVIRGASALKSLTPAPEVGLGGPSTWV